MINDEGTPYRHMQNAILAVTNIINNLFFFSLSLSNNSGRVSYSLPYFISYHLSKK